MIECIPKSLCSWDFTARGLSTGVAAVEYDWFTEQGRIVSSTYQHEIRKHGILSGRWTLERAGETLAAAHKPSAMFRSFEISSPAVDLSMQAETPFTRAFVIRRGHNVAGYIRPAHALTRRATIDCSGDVPEPVQLFAFWLAALTWKRSANNA